MGRIAPRRRKNNRVYQPLLHTWLTIRQRILPDKPTDEPENRVKAEPSIGEPDLLPPETVMDDDKVSAPQIKSPGKQAVIKDWLQKIWHLPDDFHWMEPLPLFHRRWVIIAAAVLLLALLWPSSGNNGSGQFPVTAEPTDIPLQAELRGSNPAVNQPSSTLPQGNWQSYQVQAGKTLAQLFRDNNLPVNEVFAMAQVEGNDKPLSNLKAGQEVKIILDAQGSVTALAIETANSAEVLFSRQADGSYRRDR
ncbi:hypothetical protein PL78_12890 [Yersinia entomophaga]|uniref:Opacity-associated protein A n=1 Tax=Yersinia entomophaga TaxID=935293 RepID=A0ABM7DWJ0_YERET|nr:MULTISPECIES: LysM-like peptidoglycan-binding domain-containing protein [Yersinia]ANI30714.1 hypothetical protein PL78_12890 [Yersinia entomophaga]OWF85627.1 Opacity-associated protein A domain protein [Yersinia entomophaga]